MIVTHVDPAVRRLRAKTLVLTLCDLAGCRRNPYSLGIWWQQHHVVKDVQLNRKWDLYFKGVTPRKSFREQIFSEFPSLRALFDNPLWLALSDDSGLKYDWDSLAESIRVDNQPLGAFNSSASMLLFSRVDWLCFGLMIILLRTRSPKFLLHRKWLQKNFPMFFFTACLQIPFMNFRLEVYDLLTNQLAKELDFNMVINWPSDIEGVESMLVVYNEFLDRIKVLEWLDDVEAQRILLLWIVIGVAPGVAVLFVGDKQRTSNQWPLWLRRIWIRQCQLWIGMPITLGGYHIAAPF